jgi:putative sterol carrier protein
MPGRQAVSWTETAKHFESIPVLSEFARPFPNLLEKQPDVGKSFKLIAESLSKSKRTGAIQFSIADGRKTRQWCLAMTPGGCEAMEEGTERPDLEILTDAKTWADIVGGKLAPLEAFGLGKVRVRGDIELARLFVRRVQR